MLLDVASATAPTRPSSKGEWRCFLSRPDAAILRTPVALGSRAARIRFRVKRAIAPDATHGSPL
jgi:hypothetical protein